MFIPRDMVYLINSGTDSHMLHGESHGNPIRGLREVASNATDVLYTRASSFYPIGLITCPQASKCFVLQHFCCMRSASSLKIIGFRIILLHAKPLRLQNALFYITFAACEAHQASKSSRLWNWPYRAACIA